MKKSIKTLLFTASLLPVLAACGSLSSEESIWNQRREEIPADTGQQAGPASFTPGTYEGVGTGGYGGNITVSVVIGADGAIEDVEVVSHNETEGFANNAFPSLKPQVISNQSANIDVFTGATYTSEAFIEAVADALSQAGGEAGAPAAAADFTPGTFEGVGAGGYGGDITVSVTIGANGSIEDVEVIAHNETEGFANNAFPHLLPQVISSQSADIDAFTGATYTSDAFMAAVEDALNNAR